MKRKKKGKRAARAAPKKAVAETIKIVEIESANDDMTIRVTCQANSAIGLDEIHRLQGDLKSLSEENFDKLKKSILKYGISFPVFLWRQNGTARILDGTQRDVVLKRMREEGYKIPPLPVDWIEAKDEKEAKEKILLISSQYGKMTEDSLYQFVAGNLDFNELLPMIELPQLDLKSLQKVLAEDGAPKQSAPAPKQFLVIVECSDESRQAELFERLVG